MKAILLLSLYFGGFLACASRDKQPPSSARASFYDPLLLPSEVPPSLLDLTIRDNTRNRDIPIRVYLPAKTEAAPIILFSHGLGGARENSPYLGTHWSARGYVVIFLQHQGSDDSVWKDIPVSERMAAMKRAASLENFLLRVKDVSVLLDQLATWSQEPGHPLCGRLDLQRVGMSGHSFGATTTQAVSGQATALGGQRFLDPRIKAALILSPSTPKTGSPSTAFSSVRIPWMLMTGTKDASPIGENDVASRTGVYPNLPNTMYKYELVLDKAEHSAFSDRALPGDRESRNPNHHRAILALSTAFFDAHLRQDAMALQWLQGPGASSVLERDDRWQHSAP
jgi:predicted dienelactone hydrolase